jgi:hypothetical protein
MSGFDDLLNNTPASQQPQLSKEEYAAKKQTERDAVFTVSDQTAMAVAGDGDKFQQYLDIQSKFDRYSAVNAMLIMAQKPEATRVGSFDHWKGRGGSVRTGETGIAILEPHNYTKEDGSPGVGYDIKKVFDISQIDTRRMTPTKPPPTPTERQLLSALISKAPMKITGVETLPDSQGAMTDPQTGEIQVRKGMEFVDTFKSVAYEMGYYEADRDANKIPVNPAFVGYCTAYMLSKKYGVDTQAYDFSHAPEVLRGLNPQGVKEQLGIIRDAAEAIGAKMAKQLETLKPPRSGDAR